MRRGGNYPGRVATLKKVPAATADAPASPATGTGVVLSSVELFPSWPKRLKPHAKTRRSGVRARLWYALAATEATRVRPGTCTGT